VESVCAYYYVVDRECDLSVYMYVLHSFPLDNIRVVVIVYRVFKREYYQNSSVLDCVTQCPQSASHLCEQFLQVQQIGFVTLGPLGCA